MFFLDLQISIMGNKITTCTFRKPTAANTLLQASSHHPDHLIKVIPVGKFLRLLRNCSRDDDFLRKAGEKLDRFGDRGYPHRVLKKARKKSWSKDRRDLLASNKDTQKRSSKQSPLRIIMTYGAQWGEVKNALQKHWGILSKSPALTDIVGPHPQLVPRLARNLKDSLVHSEYTRKRTKNWLTDLPTLKGMYTCGHCQMCRFIKKTAAFTDANQSANFQITNFINCVTSRVIYMLECPCKKYYIGKTKKQLRIRIGEHLRSIKNSTKEENKLKKGRHVPTRFALCRLPRRQQGWY